MKMTGGVISCTNYRLNFFFSMYFAEMVTEQLTLNFLIKQTLKKLKNLYFTPYYPPIYFLHVPFNSNCIIYLTKRCLQNRWLFTCFAPFRTISDKKYDNLFTIIFNNFRGIDINDFEPNTRANC